MDRVRSRLPWDNATQERKKVKKVKFEVKTKQKKQKQNKKTDKQKKTKKIGQNVMKLNDEPYRQN